MRRVAATVLLFLVAWGCADLVTGPAPSGDGAPRSLRVAPSALALTVGGSGRATAVLVDAAGQEVAPAGGRAIVFTSSAPAVFTVAGDGTATGVAAGQGTLTASYGAFAVGIPVTVTAGTTQPPVIDLVPAGPLVDTTIVASATRATIARSVSVANAGGGTLDGLAASVSYAGGQPTGWLQNLRLDGAVAPTSLRFDLVRGALAVGAYDAVVRVSTPRAGVAPRDLAVRLVVDYNAARIALSRDTAAATTLTGAAPVRVAVDVAEGTGLGESALGALSCADLRYASGSGWATVERCADSVVVLLDPRAVDGVVTGTLRVAAANTRDTASLALRLEARQPVLRVVPESLYARVPLRVPGVRLAADVVAGGGLGEAQLGTLRCTVAGPLEAPPMVVRACGDSVVVAVDEAFGQNGTWVYGVTVAAPDAPATVAGAELRVVIESRSVSRVEIVEGDGQVAPAGSTLPVRPRVRVLDGDGRALARVPVSFRVASGGGTLASPDVTSSDADGLAVAPAWTLGAAAGANSLVATADGVEATITATGTAVATPVLALSPEVLNVRRRTDGPALRRAVAIRETAGLGVAALGAIACEAPVLQGTTRWATVERCGPDSLVVVFDPTGLGNGTLLGGSIRVTAANARDAATLEMSLGVSTAALRVIPSPLAARVGTFGVQRVRLAADITDASLVGDEAELGRLTCTVRGNPEQPALTIEQCGDSLVATLPVDNTRGNFRATLEYLIDVDAPEAGFYVEATTTAATVRIVEVSRLDVVAGDGQSAPAGTTLPVAPRLRVVGDDGLPLAGFPITFAVTGGGGTLASGAAVPSDADGFVTAPAWTLGVAPGANTLEASYFGRVATITATGLGTGTPVIRLEPAGPVVDTLRIGVDAGREHAVAVTNAGSGTLDQLDFEVNYDAGVSDWIRELRLDATTAPTTLRWVTARGELPLGRYKASIIVTGAPGVQPVELVVELVVASTASIGFAPDPLVVRASAAPRVLFRFVDILDRSGALGEENFGPLECRIDAPPGAPNLEVVTCADTMVLRLDRNDTPGTFDYVARVAAPFATASVAPGALPIRIELLPDVGLTIVAGDGQSAPAGSTLPVPPRVRVLDALGAPIAGAPVSFVVTAGGGLLGGRTDSVVVTTDVEGIAVAPEWTLGSAPGVNELTATALEGPSRTFVATGTATASPVLGLEPDSIGISTWTNGPAIRAGVDVRELSGLGEGALGAIACGAPRYTEGAEWATVLSCGDSVIVSINPGANFNGTDRATVRVTAANSADTVLLRLRLTAFPPSIALSPSAFTISSQQNGAAFRVASGIAVRVLQGSPTSYTGTLGALACTVITPSGAPAMTVSRCGPDSVVVSATPNSAQGTYRYLVEVAAPASDPSVEPAVLTVDVTFAAAPGDAPFVANVIDGLCGIDPLGRSYCWGSNSTGRLGDGTTTRKNRANPVSTASGSFYLLRGGPGHTCAAGGTVEGFYCWGSGGSGETGLGTFSNVTLPTRVALPSNIYARLSPGSQTTCAITDDGTANQLFCWGANSRGQLGNGSTGAFTNTPTTPAAIPQTLIYDVDVADSHACAIAGAAPYTLYCWGTNWNLGIGSASSTIVQRTPVAVAFPDDLPAQGLSAGYDATCVVSYTGNNGLYCWGVNSWGAAGVGNTSVVTVPTRVTFPGLASYNARQVVVGERHSCALVGGEAWCWGDNQFGQLGRGTLNDAGSTVPVRVQTSVRFSQLSTGLYTTCGLSQADNTVWCWGYGLGGELGNGQDSNNSGVPVQVLLRP